jgi:alkaline phosphatase D
MSNVDNANANNTTTIWDTMLTSVRPQTFLWTGDAIYPPATIKGDAPLDVLRNEYFQMLHNETIGYTHFLQQMKYRGEIGEAGGIHGTWDDHDYGGNDRGHELTDKAGRRDAYLEFLDVHRDNSRWQRDGMYSSIEFGDNDGVVKVIFLDTRWHREKHCIPSVAANRYIPFGSLVACVTRWITAGLNLPSILPLWTRCTENKELLGEKQWTWLEEQLKESNASMHIIVSSIQVLTTVPVIESWGHFPSERIRLLTLLNNVPGLVILSGDVHYAEIASTNTQQQQKQQTVLNQGGILEVTSSGLTHSCDQPFYGSLCKPILDTFSAHRPEESANVVSDVEFYYTGVNFGSIDIDWASKTFQVRVHDVEGNVVLSTKTCDMAAIANMTEKEIHQVPKCMDGHLLPLFRRTIEFLTGVTIMLFIFFLIRKSRRDKNKRD